MTRRATNRDLIAAETMLRAGTATDQEATRHRYRPTRQGKCDTCGRGPRTISHQQAQAAHDAQQATKGAPTMATTAPATTKTCPGVKASGPADPLHRDPHTAPADEATFGKNAARPDGLGRVCKVCWPIYTKFLKTKAAGTTVTTEVDTTLAAISEPLAITDHDLVAAYDGKPGWSTEVVGTTRYAVPTESDTTGTDDGQAALSTWKKARDAQRKREERAAAKAAKA